MPLAKPKMQMASQAIPGVAAVANSSSPTVTPMIEATATRRSPKRRVSGPVRPAWPIAESSAKAMNCRPTSRSVNWNRSRPQNW